MGRPATGLKRKTSIEVRTSELEKEFISRKAYQLEIPKSTILREALLRDYPSPYFEQELERLRREQKGKKIGGI